MSKLTNQLRSDLADTLLKRRFDEAHSALAKREKALGIRIYEDVFDAKTRAAMKRLPAGWLPTINHAKVKFEAGGYSAVHMGEDRPVPHVKYHTTLKVYGARDPISEAYQEWESDTKSLRESRSRLEVEIRGALDSVTTIKRLLELWPELEPFVPKDGVKTLLPAINVSTLNAALKLPVSKAERKAVSP